MNHRASRRTAAMLAIVAFTMVQAHAQHARLVVPQGSALSPVRVNVKDGVDATFKGRTWITGTMIGTWNGGAADSVAPSPDFLIVPDSKSAARLPHFTIRDSARLLRYKVRSVELLNGVEAIRLAVGEARARQLMDRQVNSVRVAGKFLIEKYEVGVECDAPWAKAIMIDAKLPDKVAGYLTPPETC